jgi:hypothetical protein
MVNDPSNDRAGDVPNGGVKLGCAEVVIDRPIKIDKPSLSKHHNCGRRNRLGDRPEQVRGVRRRGALVLFVSPAEPFFPEYLAIVRHRHGNRRRLFLFELFANELAHWLELVG